MTIFKTPPQNCKVNVNPNLAQSILAPSLLKIKVTSLQKGDNIQNTMILKNRAQGQIQPNLAQSIIAPSLKIKVTSFRRGDNSKNTLIFKNHALGHIQLNFA